MGNGMDKVLPGLYIGNFRDSRDEKQLKDNKITHILSIHDNAKAIRSDMVYLCLDAQDAASQDLTQYFSQCNDFIHSARMYGGHVVVHCLAGVSRSVTLAVAYIMSVTTLGWRDALNVVRVSRTCASPNFGFQKQLLAFQHEGVAKEKSRLVSKYPTTSLQASDRDECKRLLEKHERWVLEGDSAKPTILDKMTYPLPHNAYSQQHNSGSPGRHAGTPSGDGVETSGSGSTGRGQEQESGSIGRGQEQESGSIGRGQEQESGSIGQGLDQAQVRIEDVADKEPKHESSGNSDGLEHVSSGHGNKPSDSTVQDRLSDLSDAQRASHSDSPPREQTVDGHSPDSRQGAVDNLFTQGRKDNSAKY